MQGGVSHCRFVRLQTGPGPRDGQMLPFNDDRTLSQDRSERSDASRDEVPWAFRPYGGQTRSVRFGLVSAYAQHVDDFCMVHSMHTEGFAHGPSTLFLHCGFDNFVRPSFGSWVSYWSG